MTSADRRAYFFTDSIGWAIVGLFASGLWRTQRSPLGTSETGPKHSIERCITPANQTWARPVKPEDAKTDDGEGTAHDLSSAPVPQLSGQRLGELRTPYLGALHLPVEQRARHILDIEALGPRQ